MTAHGWDNLTITGFLSAYVGVMGSMVMWTVPLFEPLIVPTIKIAFLPVTVLGVVAVLVAHYARRVR